MDRPSPRPLLPAEPSEKEEPRARAEEILRQLGGRMFLRMTGAHGLAFDAQGLRFSLDDDFARHGLNRVRVMLDPSDTYTVRAWRAPATSDLDVTLAAMEQEQAATLVEVAGVYADMLRQVFSEITGLDTSL